MNDIVSFDEWVQQLREELIAELPSSIVVLAESRGKQSHVDGRVFVTQHVKNLKGLFSVLRMFVDEIAEGLTRVPDGKEIGRFPIRYPAIQMVKLQRKAGACSL